MEKIKIRFAGKGDLNALAEMAAAFDAHFMALDGRAGAVLGTAARKLEIRNLNFTKNPLMRTLVAELGGRIIGAISFYKGFTVDHGAAYHLPYFFIRPEFRGGRAAPLFFDAIKKLARREKIQSLVFSVYGPNKNAARLYAHAGAKYWAADDEHFMYMNL